MGSSLNYGPLLGFQYIVRHSDKKGPQKGASFRKLPMNWKKGFGPTVELQGQRRRVFAGLGCQMLEVFGAPDLDCRTIAWVKKRQVQRSGALLVLGPLTDDMTRRSCACRRMTAPDEPIIVLANLLLSLQGPCFLNKGPEDGLQDDACNTLCPT